MPFPEAVRGAAGLAPMAGVTSLPFRMLAREMGCAWAVTEMVSAKGYCFSGKKLRAMREILEHEGESGILGLQLFGREPEYLARAAAELTEDGYDFIDINMGCPAPKIVSNGEGSALMREPVLVGNIVEAVVEATRLPVTVKMRAGWDEETVNAPEIARICEASGARAVCVHPRTKTMQYSGHADWDIIAKTVAAVRIPVIGNGDIRSGEDALSMLRETGCHAVSVGRGAMGNPWIFAEISAAMEGKPYTPPSAAERIETAMRHVELHTALRGEGALPEMRSHIAWYLKGAKNASRVRAEINALSSKERVLSRLRECMAQCGEEESPKR